MTVKGKMTLEQVKDLLQNFQLAKDLSLEVSDAEIEKINSDFITVMADIATNSSFGLEELIPLPIDCAVDAAVPVTGTKSITIRMPRRILAAFKKRAKRTSVPYQTLLIRELNIAARKLA
jgi:hypothetical protein